MALHAGDLGGWHGATVQQLADETTALIRWTPANSVVCSPPVRMLLGSADDLQFDAVGDRCVRVRRSSPSSNLEDALARDLDDQAAGWLSTRRARVLTGRERELRAGVATIARGRVSGVAPLFVVVGEPGIGKTRLLAELAGRGADSGDLVLVGRCTESGGAFEPFLDALGSDLFPFEAGHLERDEEGWVDRRRFFGRITSALRSFERPVTLVLDDVQWIDGSSLALLEQLLDDLGGSLAVLAGCRPGASRGVLDSFTQRPGATMATLGPLGRDDIVELAEAGGLRASAETIDGVHALSAGNPFFAVQLLGHLGDVGAGWLDASSLPVGVREWILERVDHLGVHARDTLASAAVIGRSFEVVLLSDVLGVSPLEALTSLDAASAAGLLVDGDHPGEFRFVHAIVRSTLEVSLSPTRQALLHGAIARRIEEDGVGHERLEAAMHHWFAADRLGDPLHAGEVAAEVGTQTTDRLAHEQAITILDRALEVLSGAPASSERDRIEARLRLAHGRADFVASRSSEGTVQLYRAAALADAAGDPVTLAEAALVASLSRRHGLDDPELLGLLERASAVCPPEPAVLPAMLHIRQSRLLPITVRHEDRSAMARLGLVGVDLMEPVDRATVETEVARACWSPDDAQERAALTTRHIDEASRELAVGGHSRWTGVLIEALNHRWAARMQLGDITGALEDADRAAAVADEAGTTFLLSRVMMGQAMIHATLGNDDAAERLAHDAVAMSNRHNLVLGQMAITYSVGRNRGQQAALSMLERQLADLVDSNPMFLGSVRAGTRRGRSDGRCATAAVGPGGLGPVAEELGVAGHHDRSAGDVGARGRRCVHSSLPRRAEPVFGAVGDGSERTRLSRSGRPGSRDGSSVGRTGRAGHGAAHRRGPLPVPMGPPRGSIGANVHSMASGTVRADPVGRSVPTCTRWPRGQFELTSGFGIGRSSVIDRGVQMLDAGLVEDDDVAWVEGIDVCEHHCIDFEEVAAQGCRVVVVRAGRGTRQDARWIEHVRAAGTSRLDVASYWHLYPSHTSAHHQAELWAMAVRSAAAWRFDYGHWADITTSDGFDPFDLGRYVASFLRRADELLDRRVGVFTSDQFWERQVRFDDPGRNRWRDAAGSDEVPLASFGVRMSAADRGGPGRHRVRVVATGRQDDRWPGGDVPVLVVRRPTEAVEEWRARWIRTPEVAHLQSTLNAMGAELVVDGVFGPATDLAVRTFGLLCRRDRIDWPLGDVNSAAMTHC